MENLSLNELFTFLNELNWVLRIKYKIDSEELYKIIIERFEEDIKYEQEISFDGTRNYKQEKENIIRFINKTQIKKN